MNAVDAKNAPNSSILDQHLMSLLEKTGRDLVPLEEFREREQIQRWRGTMEPRNGYEDGNYESKNGIRAITRLPEN